MGVSWQWNNALDTLKQPLKTPPVKSPGTNVMPGPPNPWEGVLSPEASKIMGMYPEFQSGTMGPGAPESVNTLRDNYFGTGMTDWGEAQIDRQRIDEADLRNVAMGDIGSARGTSESALAMRGGLSGGARERLATNMAGLQANRMQDIGRAGMAKRADIGISDEGQKAAGRQWLGQADIGDVYRGNDWNLDRARMGMDAYAADQMADAIGSGGSNSPWADPVGAIIPQSGNDVVGAAWNPASYGYDQMGIPKPVQYIVDPVGAVGQDVVKKGPKLNWP